MVAHRLSGLFDGLRWSLMAMGVLAKVLESQRLVDRELRRFRGHRLPLDASSEFIRLHPTSSCILLDLPPDFPHASGLRGS